MAIGSTPGIATYRMWLAFLGRLGEVGGEAIESIPESHLHDTIWLAFRRVGLAIESTPVTGTYSIRPAFLYFIYWVDEREFGGE